MTDSLPACLTGTVPSVLPAVETSPSAQPVPDRVPVTRRMSLKATKRTPFQQALAETQQVFQGLFGEASAALGRTDAGLHRVIQQVCKLHATGEQNAEEYDRWREQHKIERHGNARNPYKCLFRVLMRDCPRPEIKKASKYGKVANVARANGVPIDDIAEWIGRQGGIEAISARKTASIADDERLDKAERERRVTEFLNREPVAVIDDHPALDGLPEFSLAVIRRVGGKLYLIAPLTHADARRAVRREVAQ